MGKSKEETQTVSLESRRAQGPQATIQQSLIDINVVDQELPKGAPKIGQIPS
jgi:hypothetical protein